VAGSLLEQIIQAPVLPTVFPLEADTLCAYAEALHAEGYPALEVLARPLEQALGVMRQVMRSPQRRLIAWGMGTVLTESAARQAVELQPDFLVSPAFSRRVLHVAAQAGIPYIPGVRTFQDVQAVLDAFEDEGLTVEVLKLCPIEGVTLEYMRSLSGCFPGIVFCPSGTLPLAEIARWTRLPYLAAPMDSKFVSQELLETRDVEGIRKHLRMIRRFAESALETSLDGDKLDITSDGKHAVTIQTEVLKPSFSRARASSTEGAQGEDQEPA
jgi:2-dehydro-3-deoxyphosphogluconate aldolase/(4S)-4-hydroxy-2-oxoglutarate aldolase